MTSVALLMFAAAVSAPADTVTITEWQVPWERSRPRDPYPDAQGRVWFVGQTGNYIAYFDQKTEEFKRYELDPGVNPHNLIVDKGGTVWYAGNRASHIGKLDPATGNIAKFMMPDTTVRDPHTLAFAPDGNIWFTAQGGNAVGHLNVISGAVRLIKMPARGARPYGIVTDPQNQAWFAQIGANRIGRVDPATMELKEFMLADEGTRVRRLVRTSDGIIWYSDYSRGHLGRLDPASGAVREWAMPSGARALPYAMAVDHLDRLWFVETGVRPNLLVGFDPRTEKFFSSTPVLPSGAGTIRHMVYHEPTRTIWFGTDTNMLGKAVVPAAVTLTP